MENVTFSKIIRHGDTGIEFLTTDGHRYLMHHDQDCCERVSIEDICGELDDLVGSRLIRFEERHKNDTSASESGTWTFYELATNKGSVTIRWYGSSNGYYSERADFVAISECVSLPEEIGGYFYGEKGGKGTLSPDRVGD